MDTLVDEYGGLEELGEQLYDRSLLELMPDSDDGVYVPHKDKHVDADRYLRTVIAIQFDEDHGSPYWREQAEELDIDPRETIEGFDDLDRLPEADEDDIREYEVRDLVPELFGDEDGIDPGYIDLSKSSGTTGQKKLMPWLRTTSADTADWYAHHIDEHTDTDGDWLVCGPYGLFEKHHEQFTDQQDAFAYFTGMESKGLKRELRALDAIQDSWFNAVDPRTAYQGARGMLRLSATQDALADDLQNQDVTGISTAPPIAEQVHGLLEDDSTASDPEDIEAVLLGGTAINEDSVDRIEQLYPEADVMTMYATSFTGPAFEQDSGSLTYRPPEPFMTFDVREARDGSLDDRETVEYGERGQVVFHRISEGFFWPNQAERETAVRTQMDGGDGIADIRPMD